MLVLSHKSADICTLAMFYLGITLQEGYSDSIP